ncbi:MAG TPA: hypothetical protein VLJ16_00725 [Acidobacteriota bacterium]|nr:hypothetical protein [Acidobacteriota bacterium]
MEYAKDGSFGSGFERIFVGLAAIATGLTLVFLAVQGPLIRGVITYKTAAVINNQLIGQDAVNLVLMSPLLLAAGILLLLRKPLAKYLLIATPLFLIYYVMSYTIGWEWSSPAYTGNSERYFFLYLLVLIAALVFLLYALAVFPKNVESRFKKGGLAVYSAAFALFLLIFAGMWAKEVLEVIRTGTTRGYDLAPTAFWMIRVFDLGFSIPLGFISLYLLWARPNKAYPIVCLFYGFFFTQIIAVLAMGWMMFINKDPTFLWRDLIVFSVLAVIIAFGFFYVRRNIRVTVQT